MAQLADFISRIFSSGRTQGLSGGVGVVEDQDPAASFYAARMRKHHTDADFLEDPGEIWSCESWGGRPGGLRAHLMAERGDGVASFTDVLLVINSADARRVQGADAWSERAARAISEQYATWAAREKFELLYGTRPLRFWIVADGGRDMRGQSFGLDPGEFITGLVPNVYVGPAERSRPVLAVHLNIPGQWEGYREVGRLYSDQMVFTLGRHWLDNFAHAELREPGLYRLQQYPDGSLVHTISPELQDRYLVRSDAAEGGASVLTLATWEGRPIAYLVLAVIESATVDFSVSRAPLAGPSQDFAARPSTVEVTLDESEAAAPAAARTWTPPSGPADTPPRIATLPVAGGAVAEGPVAGEPEPAVGALEPAITAEPAAPAVSQSQPGLSNRQKTIVPDAVQARLLTLQERGALLQKVHFGAFMEGYDVYVSPRGQVATLMEAPRAVLQVRGGRVALVAHGPRVKVDGREIPPERPIPLVGKVQIEIEGVALSYRDLSGIKAEGWPYVGEVRRSGSGSYLEFGATYRVGRDRRCKVRLPDEPHNDNIAWLASVGSGASIRSRTGDIPKSRFYTDSIMVASEHAEIDLAGEPRVRSLAKHCYTYVRRGDEIVVLFPREGPGGKHEAELLPGDELLVGNCLFAVSYAPAQPSTSVPPQGPKFSPSDLAEAVAPLVPTPPRRRAPTVDPVAAAGLGERGPAPKPMDLPPSGPDSFTGEVTQVRKTDRALRRERTAEHPARPPARSGAPMPPMLVSEEDADPVLSVEESQWQLELSRPAQLVQVGWMVGGEGLVGNHRGSSMVVPEVKAFAEQAFMTLDYFRVFVRGRKGKVELLQEGEASLTVHGGAVHATENLDDAVLQIVRRDENLEPDFEVRLLFRDAPLPDPRARLLTVDATDRLTAALFTKGFPMRADRRIRLGPVEATAHYDGSVLRISDYLTTYRLGNGAFAPLFSREGERGWRTFPEDGTPVSLRPGDGLLAGTAVWRFATA
jgi:ADP-ribose pyrophosphatase YjhB (NUDIX family)